MAAMKYQIVLLGTPWNVESIHKTIGLYFGVEFVDVEDVNNKYPLLYLYFGKNEGDASVNEHMDKLLHDAVTKHIILPIAEVPDDFKSKIPPILKGLNGFFMKQDDLPSVNRLGNYVASFFGFVNSNKKVFISYRRTELETLAQKLYVSLIKMKYHPFLDSYSIEAGVDFQEYLRHELVDSDILILLDSPDFNSSEYCMEEFNIANQERIPVLDIRFNVDPKKNMHRFCDFYETDMDCAEANESDELPSKIIEIMEGCQVRAYQAKRKFVIDAFNAHCNRYDLHAVEQGGFLRCDTTHECFYPLTRIPTVNDMFHIHTMFKSLPLFSTYSKQILYNGSYCRPDIQSCLSWLDSNLPINVVNVNK